MSTRPLTLYIDDDNQIWALDQANNIAYRLQKTAGSTDYPPAPPAKNPSEPSQISLTSENKSFRTELAVDPLGGDLVAKNIVGPNAGKSTNLTYGKWA